MPPCPQCRLHLVVVAESQNPVADDLAGFVALAGDQQHVARWSEATALRIASRGRRSHGRSARATRPQ